MKQARITRHRVGNGAILVGWLFGALLGCVSLFSSSAFAATGINQQISYQARLLDSTGAVVPDGTYNMEFKIYQDGDGILGGGDETLEWTETRTGGNKVTVKNGYFSVMLGFVNPFGSSVDWNQDTLWLSTNIGGTGTPAWDGEMSPFRRFGTAAYALNANQLGGLSAASFLQIAPSAVQTDGSTASSLFLNKTGVSGNILQLQKSGVDVLTVSNSGLATFGSGISVSGDTITDFAGNGLVVSSNILTVRLDTTAADGSSTSSVSGLEFVGGELSLIRGCDAGQVLQWDNSNFEWDCATISGGSGYATVQDEGSTLTQRSTLNFTGAGVSCADNAGSSRTDCTISGGGSSDLDGTYDTDSDKTLTIDNASGLLFNMTTTGDFAVQDNGVSVLTVNDNGTLQFKPSADNATAFEIQKSGSTTQLFIVDSSNDRIYIGDDTADGTGTQLVLDTKNTAGDPTSTVDGAMYYNSDSKNFRCRHNGLWQDCDFASLRSEWVVQEDFASATVANGTTGTHGWTSATIGTGGTGVKISSGSDSTNYDRFGIFRLGSAATTVNTGWNTRLDITSITGVPSNMTTEFDFAPVTANAAAGTNQTIYVGLHNGTNNTTAPVDGLYFRYLKTTTAGNWERCTQATCVDTGVARTTTANQYQRFKIVTNAAGTGVEFFINETSVGTATTNLPTQSSGDVYGPSITSFASNSAPSSAMQWKIDYFQIKRNMATLR